MTHPTDASDVLQEANASSGDAVARVELTPEQVEDYRRRHLLPRGVGNKLNDLDHAICDMAWRTAQAEGELAEFDEYVAYARERKEYIERLERGRDALLRAAFGVTRWDWSNNDEDCVRDIDNLRTVAEQVSTDAGAREELKTASSSNEKGGV